MPVTTAGCGFPRWVATVVVSPTARWWSSAYLSETSSCPARKVRMSPADLSKPKTVAMPAGSPAATSVAPVPTCAVSRWTAVAELTPGTCRTSRSTASGKPPAGFGPGVSADSTTSAFRSEATSDCMLSFSEVARTLTPVTSVTPTISAAAVMAVRRGLRAEFRLPNAGCRPRDQPPKSRDHGPADGRSEHRDADEPEQHSTEQDGQHRSAKVRVQRCGDRTGGRNGKRATADGEFGERPVGCRGTAHGGDRCDTRRAQRWEQRRHHRDDDAYGVRGNHRCRRDADSRRQVRPADGLHECPQPDRHPNAGAESDRRCDDPDEEGLEQNRPHDLPRTRSQRTKQGELLPALRDQDPERVEDQEDSDEEGDGCEPEQHGAQDADEVLDTLVLRVRILVSGLDFVTRTGDLLDLIFELRRARPVSSVQVDPGPLAGLADHQLLCRCVGERDA